MKLEPAAIQLRFVPLARLLTHEEDDPFRVKRLIVSLQHAGCLRNPPIVSEAGDGYLVLDGATRAGALHEMGLRDVVVQIVKYDGEAVQLSSWHHVLAGLPPNRMLGSLADVDGVTLQPVDGQTAYRMLETREIAADVVMRNGQHFAVLCEGDAAQKAHLLCRMVAEYRGKAEVHRTIEVDLPTLIEEYPQLAAVIVFPTYTPNEIVQIALAGYKVPMGITRHIVAGRALGLDVPLKMLGDGQTLEEKNRWLQEMVHKRLQANKIRLYQEPVFIFDE